MENIVIPIGLEFAKCLVAPIQQRARYLFRFNLFIEELEKEKHGLKTRLDEVKEHKEQVARKSEEITLPVKNWLKQVDTILEDVEKLRQEVGGGGKSCFNMSLRYSLAKQMDDKAKQMMELQNNSHFDHFSCITPLTGITYSSSKDFMSFDSRKSTYTRLLEAIKDGKNRMTGLYGMGGSGKTTLAKEVGKEVHDLKLFDKIIMVVVSKPPNAEKIQQEIAEKIDFKFPYDTQFTRAQRLSERLKNMKILMILDDVWEWLSLEDVGIPLVEGHHILLTTRQRNVCISMDCEPIIKLPLIAKEEAWELFKKHANLFDDPLGEFHDVGKKIIDECNELPIAIVVVGSSLKGKSIYAWKSALRKLKHSQPMNVEQGLRSPYACLELSYDNLPSSTTKSLFLLCSMFPEDHAIHKEDLIRLSKGIIELKEIIGTMEDVREEIVVALQILLDSCLLMSTDGQACVKMHDLVRDVALWIARKQGKAILVDSHEISNISASNHQSLKDTRALSLWNLDENFKLSNQLHCSRLEIMLLHPCGLIEDLGAINALEVLALIKLSFTWDLWWQMLADWSIPRSIMLLTNLHTLCFRGINLGDISFFGELKGLEIIDLRGSSFNELPAAIVDMKMLKLLDMFGCKIGKSPLEVIGRCEQLEELYFWDNKSVIPENFSLSRLKRYVIFDSTCGFDRYEVPFQKYLDGCDEALKFLCIQSFKVSALNSSMKDLIHSANFLWLENCGWDHKDINSRIKHLGASCCQEKKFIIGNLDVNILQTQQQVFSHLVTLSLVEMKNLEQVFQDSSISCSLPMLQQLRIRSCPALETCIFTSTTITSLPKLRELHIHDCNKVKWMFSCSLASNCPSLEKICITYCSQLERLIEDDDAAQGNPLIEEMQYYPCGNEINGAYVGLTAKSPTAQIVSLHRLKEVELRRCKKLKNIFTLFTVTSLPELIKVIIDECEEWEGIFCEELKNLSSSLVCFPNLEIIRVFDCHKVKRLFSHSLASHCPSLKEITIYDCSQLEGVVQAYDGQVVDNHNERLLFPKLNHLDLKGLPKLREIYSGYKDETERVRVMNSELHDLYLEDLPKLEYIWKGPTTQIVSLNRIEEVQLRRCPKLKNIFTPFTVTCLPELRKVEVYICEEWEGIFCTKSIKNLSFSIVCFPKLKTIEVYHCHKVKGLFSHSLASHCPSLEIISIYDCSQLEGVVQAYQGDVDDHHERLPFPKLNYLDLRRLPKLTEIYPDYKDEKERVRVMDSELHDIYLEDLPKLEYIWKGPNIQIVSLNRLEEVELRRCPKLKNFFTLSTVTSLPELRKVKVHTCEEWEGIFCQKSLKNLSSSIFCFLKLKTIELYHCHKVKRLFSLSLASHCPSLETISIHDCSKLEAVVQAYEGEVVDDHHERLPFPKLNRLDLIRLPKLREIYPCYKDTTERVRVMNSELHDIYLEDLSELEYIWKGPTTQIVSLHRLKEVKLWRCPKLKNIFTLFTTTSLPELMEVTVDKCEEWEGIFCEESLKNISSSIVCFPKLEIIRVFDCHKVKRLFSHFLASHCPSLKRIIICGCFQLEGVVQAYEGEFIDDHHERLLFPKLNYFYLGSLPKLRDIYPGYEFDHISGTILIQDCPKICNIPLEFKASSDSEIKSES